ncbi:hypothetical protein [Paenibacillus ehimensis]|uniref:hypothetical protein n=1 Tax=Paenibacillus ehimensis TaxID=79264 RepID=UPI00047214C3|nr:hypothetical protein [Paenibacillus ehimensis]
MSLKDIDQIAAHLSVDLDEQYREELRCALYEHDPFLVEMGFVNKDDPMPNPTIEDKLRIVSLQLKKHSERFTVELIKRLFSDQTTDHS